MTVRHEGKDQGRSVLPLRLLALGLALPLVLGCASGAPTSRILLVETTPVETPLDDPARPNAADVWPVLIDGAESHIDWAAFYISDREDSRLTPVLQSLVRAVGRGVRVRVLADAGFFETYPDWLNVLDAHGAIVRLVDFEDGGAMHAKYFVIDGSSAYVGSQNSDWRALEHIYEMGAWTDDDDATAALAEAFSMDWALAADIGGGGTSNHALPPATDVMSVPERWPVFVVPGEEVSAVMSPEGRLAADPPGISRPS